MKEDDTIMIFVAETVNRKYKLVRWKKEAYKEWKRDVVTDLSDGDPVIRRSEKKVYYLDEGKLFELNPKNNKTTRVKLNTTFERSLKDEFHQMFFETWSGLAENYYDPTYHGRDWAALGKQYGALLPHVHRRSDLRLLTDSLLGELGSSHLGLGTSGDEEDLHYDHKTWSIGLEWADENPYVVSDILRGGPAAFSDKGIRVGDRLIAVEGQPVDTAKNRNTYFSGAKRPEEIELTFERAGRTFDVALHPVPWFQHRQMLYERWIDTNQERVDQKSKRRIAYIHMKDMGNRELDRFIEELHRELPKRDALIFDLRNNTGGNVHGAVLDHLIRKTYAQWRYRDHVMGNQPVTAPADKPIVLLSNRRTLSDGEMATEGFKQLGLGKVIGTPTMSWLIFTSSKGLVDGSRFRLPAWGCYTMDGRNMELEGVKPDIEIAITPADHAAGRDPQLDKAIALILEQLD